MSTESDICEHCGKEIDEFEEAHMVKGIPYSHAECHAFHGSHGTGWSPSDQYD